MAVRGEEVASSIDVHVREEIEKMVGEIRSSIEDVRVFVDSQLKAALQSAQADVKAISFLPFVTKSIAELEQGFADAAPAPVAAPAAPAADSEKLKRAVQTIERGKSQVDVLNSLLDQCLDFGSRAALLILRGETFSGWKGVGFNAHGGNDENVKRFNAAPGLIPELDVVLRSEQVVQWDGANLSTRLGVAAGATAIFIPMVIKDKVAAAIYVDATDADRDKLDGSALQILVFITGLLIDTLATRKKIPSPSLKEGDASATPSAADDLFSSGAPAAAPVPAPAPAPRVAAPAPAPTPAPVAPAAPPPSTGDATVAFNAAQMRESMAAARPSFNMPTAEDFGTPAPKPAPPPAPEPPPPVAAPPAATGGDEKEKPSTQFIPPAGISRGGAFATPQTEDAKKHDEARRFARLLVSEIKLYNESKVDQGRRNKDLYERLKEDIDRSRQMYDDRIAEDVRKSSNYFYDELVRILADGKTDALGL